MGGDNGRSKGGKGGGNKGSGKAGGKGGGKGRRPAGKFEGAKGNYSEKGGGKYGGKGGFDGGSRRAAFVRPVQEERRIQLCRDMEAFRDSDETELKFPLGLDNHERATLHQHAKKLGLFTKSSGKGETRQLSVWRHKVDNGQNKQPAQQVGYCTESVSALETYFEEYPIDEDDEALAASHPSSRLARGGSRSKSQQVQHWPPKNSNQWAKLCKKGLEGRKQLPSWDCQAEVLEAVTNNQVVLISGETGCGKTTQVPQFILDALHTSGAKECNIVCTQPRRIAAISVAERVASERGEGCGQTVGYQVRLEHRSSANTALMFCTTGIVLRRLASDPELKGVTHLIIDEVHERDHHTDFALIILKKLLPRRPDLHLILMSATLDAPLFVDYFGGCPVVHIPGFTYPVQECFLEEALEHSKFMQHSMPRHCSPEMDGAALSEAYLSVTDPDNVDIHLVAAMVHHVVRTSREGAVLVFLPGWEEINRLRDRLISDSSLDVMVLHSLISSAEQSRVFRRPRNRTRKVVLSTNIAETSITINDVVFVINSGRIKMKSFDPHTGMSVLQTQWVSSSSERQRKGRAGRCQEGVCYHLYSKTRSNSLADNQLAEILRTPLEEICLQVKLLGDTGGTVEDFLSAAIEAPANRAVQGALELLASLGALDLDQNLTHLGKLLADLPVHPKIGKMLLLAIMFECFDPVLVAACSLAYREPFVVPVDARPRAEAQQKREAYGAQGFSDHLALIRAFDGWEKEMARGGRQAGQSYCRKQYLNHNTLDMISGMRNQITRELFEAGLLKDSRAPISGQNDCSSAIVTAVLCAGLHPNALAVRSTAQSLNLYDGRGETRIGVHQSSLNSGLAVKTALPFLWCYSEMTRGDATVKIRDCSAVSPAALFLLCGELDESLEPEPAAEPEDDLEEEGWKLMMFDGWLRYALREEMVPMLQSLKRRVQEVFLRRLAHPHAPAPTMDVATVSVTARMLWEEMQQVNGMSSPLREMSGFAEEAQGPSMQLWGRSEDSKDRRSGHKKSTAPQEDVCSLFEAVVLDQDQIDEGSFGEAVQEFFCLEEPEFEFEF